MLSGVNKSKPPGDSPGPPGHTVKFLCLKIGIVVLKVTL